MINRMGVVVFFIALSFSHWLFAGDAEISVSLSVQSPPWTGQQVTVNLDLKTSDLSFTDVFFNLPQVEGAFLIRTDSSTVKLSERRGTETWQVLRYPIALFPQGASSLTLPAFPVRFKTTAGFGSEPTSHALTTEPLTLQVRQPPGVDPGAIVVTTPDHQLQQDWQVPQEPIQAGDAITLIVRREAASISAMLLPELPVYETEGLAAYAAEPEINDRSNRGSLRGTRTDRITWVVERAGDYSIPAIRFQWWDPQRERLREVLVDGLAFSADAGSGQPPVTADPLPVSGGTNSISIRAILVLLVAGVLAGLAWRYRLMLLRCWHLIAPPPRALLKSLNPRTGPR